MASAGGGGGSATGSGTVNTMNFSSNRATTSACELHCDCATADSVASLAAAGAAEADDALTEIEAAQLVVQLARLQELAEAQFED